MPLEDEIANVTAELLPKNAELWCQRFKKDKIIHDGLWGTFALKKHELALLDTPLLQRLRFIRQTGAVYLTYPSALHTRFEHTLGVVFQATKLCQALRRDSSEMRIDEGFETNVRFAALLHDTGHGPFSHTSEQYFSVMPAISEARERLGEDFRESGAGEILSYLISQCQPMKTFIEVLSSFFKVDLIPEEIGKMITGTFDDANMYRGEIIHGPFDADKLDYMPRDGMFSGLKMHVDVDRLFNSIKIEKGSVEDREGKLAPFTQVRLAGSIAGISPLTQLMFNKMLLYTGIYHHHKVRAVDCMVWAIFGLAHKCGATIGGQKIKSPSDFLRVTDDRLLTEELTDNNDIRALIGRIRNRDIWQRALIISRHTTPESAHNKLDSGPDAKYAGFRYLAGNEPERIYRRQEIADRIWEKAGKPCKSHEIWLDVPKSPGMSEARDVWILSPGNKNPRTLGDFIPIGKWVELYGMHQWKSHVFCPREHVRAIGTAAEAVLHEVFGLEFLETAYAFEH